MTRPIWLENMEWLLGQQPDDYADEAISYLATLEIFGRLGMAWIDRTHVASNADHVEAVRTALARFDAFGDLTVLDPEKYLGLVNAIAFQKRARLLLRSIAST